MAKKNDEIKYEIVQHFGVLKSRKNGWKKELNKVSWNEEEPKYDIREWNEEHDKMSRGITLSEDEFKNLIEVLKFNFEF